MSARKVVFLYHIPKTAGQSMRHALADKLGLHEGFIQVGPFGDKRSHAAGIPPFGERSVERLAAARVVAGHYLRSDMSAKFPGATIESAIVLREPAARLVSHYNHAMFIRNAKCGEPVVDLERWYDDEQVRTFPWERLAGRPLTPRDVREAMISVGDNYMAKFVMHAHGDVDYADYDDDTLLERTTRILDGFSHVGVVEAMDATQDFLARALEMPLDVARHNVAGPKRPRVLELTDDVRSWIDARNRVDGRLYARYRGRL